MGLYAVYMRERGVGDGGCIDLDVQPTLYFLSLYDQPTALVFQNYHLQIDVELDSVVILTCAAVVFGTRTP